MGEKVFDIKVREIAKFTNITFVVKIMFQLIDDILLSTVSICLFCFDGQGWRCEQRSFNFDHFLPPGLKTQALIVYIQWSDQALDNQGSHPDTVPDA